ncbi:MAG: hypothetical protein LBQ50_08585 [Planctomycetaceae bacterium]|jgi:hypothetical protein|nr:hypothetical protein [Planctomycetaceae bacterium]
MVTRKLEITEQIEAQLQPFIEECERRGYPITDVRVIESIPGVHNSFVLEFIADWLIDKDKGMDDFAAIRLFRNILRETTPKEVHQFIYGIVPDLSPDVATKWKAELRAKYGQST